jgi:hypothetical protein
VTTSVQEQPAVATDARHWDVGSYRIWESATPGVLLYARHDVRLATDARGRPVASVMRSLAWDGAGYTPTGGSAVLGFAGAGPDDAAVLLSLQDAWTREVRGGGYAGASPGADPRYAPLPVRDVAVSADLDPAQASLSGEPAGTTLTVDLTAQGALAWAAAIRDHAPVPGTVRLTYSYPQLLPPATALVQVHGRQVYARLASTLAAAPDGELSGTEAQIRAAWADLVRSEAIAVTLTGSPAGTLARSRDDLVDQVRENLFATMFRPLVVTTGEAPRYALRWKRAADVPDLPLMVSVEGPSWVTDSLDAGVTQLLSQVPPDAVHDVLPSVSVPVTVYVDASEAVESVGVSVDFGDLRAPEALTFGPAGGHQTFLVTTDRPEQLVVRYRVRADFRSPSWPVLTVDGTTAATVTPQARRADVFVRPDDWLRRHEVWLFMVRGGRLAPGEWPPEDLVTLTIHYENPAFPGVITDTARIELSSPLSVTVPVPPAGPPGRLTVTALGSLGGQVVRAETELRPDSDAQLFVLAGDGGLRFVDDSTPLPESDPLGQRLLAARGRPVVRHELPPAAESGRDLAVTLDVPLVPQPTSVSGWAAALATVVGARDGGVPPTPAAVAGRAGLDVDTAYAWPQIREAVAAWGLVAETPRGSPPQEWAALLREWGPIAVVETGAPHHVAVAVGITGDGTPDGTWVRLHDPWPPGVGSVALRIFTEFDQEFGPRAGSGVAMVHG